MEASLLISVFTTAVSLFFMIYFSIVKRGLPDTSSSS